MRGLVNWEKYEVFDMVLVLLVSGPRFPAEI